MTNRLLILSYNLLFGRAESEVCDLAKKIKPDIVCVQEFTMNEGIIKQFRENGYELADYSPSFFKHFRFYSVATFYNPKTLKYENGSSISLTRGFYELLLFFLRLSPTSRTALNNNFVMKKNKRSFRLCNMHLTAMQSTNSVRLKQLKTTLEFLSKKNNQLPTIVLGDFNYMYKRKILERIFQKEGYVEATNNLFFTISYALFWFFRLKMKPDYIWYKGFKHYQTKRLNHRSSDHYPIVAEFAL